MPKKLSNAQISARINQWIEGSAPRQVALRMERAAQRIESAMRAAQANGTPADKAGPDWEGRAAWMKSQDPKLTCRAVASTVGVSPSMLYRSSVWQDACRMAGTRRRKHTG